jgi:hypothetical protein
MKETCDYGDRPYFRMKDGSTVGLDNEGNICSTGKNTNDYPNNDRDNDKDYGSYSGSQYGGEEKYGPGAKERYEAYIGIDGIDRSNSGATHQDIKEQAAHLLRHQQLMKGFTGQSLGGYMHNKIHCRNYEEKPNVNKEMLAAVRKIGRENNAQAINFILFHKHYLNDDDMYWLTSVFNTHKSNIAVNTIDLSNNCISLTPTKNMPFFSFNYPFYTTWNVLRLDLSNNNIGDDGAKCIADGLAKGFFPITKQINLSGNKVTKEGHKSLMTALDSPKVKSIMVGLVQNIADANNTIDKAVKSTLDFLSKGLQYTIEEHNKGLKGTKWDGSSVRSDSMDKWKNCKEVGQNIQKGAIGGLIKCLPLSEAPPAMFACVAQQSSMELLDPDTFWCIAEVHKFVDETEVMGDCIIF